MNVIGAACEDWLATGRRFAVATLVTTEGSSPRPVGTSMIIAEDGDVRGSLSGGCVEADVVATGLEVLENGIPERRTYGITDAAAWEVGLMCGGSIDVMIQPVCAADDAAGLAEMLSDAPAAVLWRLDAPRRRIALGVPAADDPAAWTGPLADLLGVYGPDTLRRMSVQVASQVVAGSTGALAPLGDCAEDLPPLFLAVRRPAPRLIVTGTTDLAAALLEQGRVLGYRTTVCDSRAAFLTPARFPAAEEIVVDRPHHYLAAEHEAGRLDARTVICCLGHDPAIDDPLVETALALPLAYVGAMGSRRTHRERLRRLAERGVPATAIGRLHSPIGLDLGGSTPAEFALAVMAEVVAERSGRPRPRSLRTTTGPLHGRIPA